VESEFAIKFEQSDNMRVRPWQTMQRHFLRFVTGV